MGDAGHQRASSTNPFVKSPSRRGRSRPDGRGSRPCAADEVALSGDEVALGPWTKSPWKVAKWPWDPGQSRLGGCGEGPSIADEATRSANVSPERALLVVLHGVACRPPAGVKRHGGPSASSQSDLLGDMGGMRGVTIRAEIASRGGVSRRSPRLQTTPCADKATSTT